MSTQQEHYMICNGCGETCVDEDGFTLRGETPECARDEAEGEGWIVYQGGNNKLDYCIKCAPQILKDSQAQKNPDA